MPIQRGDFVRPNNRHSLPQGSVWRVICSEGTLKLEPENAVAQRVERIAFAGLRFSAQYFDKVVLFRGEWTTANAALSSMRTRIAKARPDPVAVAVATIAAEQAALDRLLEAARKLEAVQQDELRIVKAAKAKADKEAAARAKMEEVRKALAAKLHADRCLAEATLELIAEVSRLNNGGSEQVADASIAQHAGQLQALAKSYGYRIVKPSMLAQVVKL